MVLKAQVSPSIVAANLARLRDECKLVLESGADSLHIDVTDGKFFPNVTWGLPVALVQSLRKETHGFFDCHMMVSDPEEWVIGMAAVGADMFTFHIEATRNAEALIRKVRGTRMMVGIALAPQTPLESILDIVPLVDRVLIMTADPDGSDQPINPDDMLPEPLEKIAELRKLYPALNIQVEGGIDCANVDVVAKAGANHIVSGYGIFKHHEYIAGVIEELHTSVKDHIASTTRCCSCIGMDFLKYFSFAYWCTSKKAGRPPTTIRSYTA